MKKSIGEKAFDVLMYGCIGISILLILYPLYFILIASISDQNLVANGRVFLIPKGIQYGGFKRVFENDLLLSGYRNTILYTALGTVVNMVLTIPGRLCVVQKGLSAQEGSDVSVCVHHVFQRRIGAHLFVDERFETIEHHMGNDHSLCSECNKSDYSQVVF